MFPFGTRRGSGWFPGNAQRRSITVAGVDPRSVASVGIIDRDAQRPLQGAVGRIIIGEGSSPTWKASGYVDYQALAAASLRPLGAQANVRTSPNIALPATAGEVAAVTRGNSVMDSLALIPPGVR